MTYYNFYQFLVQTEYLFPNLISYIGEDETGKYILTEQDTFRNYKRNFKKSLKEIESVNSLEKCESKFKSTKDGELVFFTPRFRNVTKDYFLNKCRFFIYSKKQSCQLKIKDAVDNATEVFVERCITFFFQLTGVDFSFLRRIKEEERYETRREMQKCIESLFEEILNLFQCNVRVQDHYRDSNGKIVWYSIDGDFTTIEEITKRVKIVFMRTRKTMFEQGMMSKPYLPYLPCDIDSAMNINKDLCIKAFRCYPNRKIKFRTVDEAISKNISDDPSGEYEKMRRYFKYNKFQKALDKVTRTRYITDLWDVLEEECCCGNDHKSIKEKRDLCIYHIIESYYPKFFNFDDVIDVYFYYESRLSRIPESAMISNGESRDLGCKQYKKERKLYDKNICKKCKESKNCQDKHCRMNLSEINEKMLKLRDTLWYVEKTLKKENKFPDSVLQLLEKIEYFCCFIMIKNTSEL